MYVAIIERGQKVFLHRTYRLSCIGIHDSIVHFQARATITIILVNGCSIGGHYPLILHSACIVGYRIVVESSLLNVDSRSTRVFAPYNIIGKQGVIARSYQQIDTTSVTILVITACRRGVANTGIEVVDKETTDDIRCESVAICATATCTNSCIDGVVHHHAVRQLSTFEHSHSSTAITVSIIVVHKTISDSKSVPAGMFVLNISGTGFRCYYIP